MKRQNKYIVRIGGNEVGRFGTQKECRDYAREHGGYRYGWSVWNTEDGRMVTNKGESAVHQTARIHREFNNGIESAASFIWNLFLVLVSGGVLLMLIRG